jgi:hypothetical protein
VVRAQEFAGAHVQRALLYDSPQLNAMSVRQSIVIQVTEEHAMADTTGPDQMPEPWRSVWSRPEDIGTVLAILFFLGLSIYAWSQSMTPDGLSRIHVVAVANSTAGALIAASRLASQRNPRWLHKFLTGIAVVVLVANAAQFWGTR